MFGKAVPALQGKNDVPARRREGTVSNTGRSEHALCGNVGFGSVVFVAVIDDFGDARLDEGLRALVTGEECRVNAGALNVGTRVIEDGIQFRVAYIEIFGIEIVAFALPRILVIGAALRHAVVADGKDPVLGAYDTCSDTRVGVFAPLRGKKGDSHEILVPGQIIGSFHHVHLRIIDKMIVSIRGELCNIIKKILGVPFSFPLC